MIFTMMIATILFTACNKVADENASSDYYNDSEAVEMAQDTIQSESEVLDSNPDKSAIPMSSTAANYHHPDKKFVRTADLAMEVKNVYQSTTRIENKIAELGGFVAKTNLESNVFSEETFPISSDSAVQVKQYSVSNFMTIRVPERSLSAFLISLGDEMEFLNYRNIEADDVSLQLLFSQMEQRRMKSTAGKLDNLSVEKGKTADKQIIISSSDQKQSGLNQEIINELDINDQIAYSTISLKITESEKMSETPVVNLKTASDKYRPGFWYSIGNSIKGGYELLQSIVVGLVYLWPVFLLGGLLYLTFKKYRKMRKAQKIASM